MRKHHWVSQVGFTMTEILIAMAIVGLLAAIALPAYQQSTRKANRADAKITMARLARIMPMQKIFPKLLVVFRSVIPLPVTKVITRSASR